MSLIQKYNGILSLLDVAIDHLKKEKRGFSDAADQLSQCAEIQDQKKNEIIERSDIERSEAKTSTIEAQIELLSRLKNHVSVDLASLNRRIAAARRRLTACDIDWIRLITDMLISLPEESESQQHREKLLNYLSVYFFIIQGSSIDFGLLFFTELSEVDSFDKLAMIDWQRSASMGSLYLAMLFTLIFFLLPYCVVPVVVPVVPLILASFSALLLSLTLYLCSLTNLNSITEKGARLQSKLESTYSSSDVEILSLMQSRSSTSAIPDIISSINGLKKSKQLSSKKSIVEMNHDDNLQRLSNNDIVMLNLARDKTESPILDENENIAKAITYVAQRIKNTESSTFHNGEAPDPGLSFELPPAIICLRSRHEGFFSSVSKFSFFKAFDIPVVIEARQLASHLTTSMKGARQK